MKSRILPVVAVAVLAAAGLVAGALLAAGRGDDGERGAAGPPRCDEHQLAEWKRLANEIRAPVYCPGWLPDPLVSDLHHPSIDPDRSFQVGYHDSELRSAEVHVVLGAYPDRRIPRCEDLKIEKYVPCWLDSSGRKQVGPYLVTVYERALGHESQHVVYTWTYRGVLYTASMHIDRRENSAVTRVVAKRNLDLVLLALDRVDPDS